MSHLAFKSTGKQQPRELELPQDHILSNSKFISVDIGSHQPFREIDSPAKVMFEVEEESPTKFTAGKLVNILGSGSKGSKAPSTFSKAELSLTKTSIETLLTRSPSPTMYREKMMRTTEGLRVEN